MSIQSAYEIGHIKGLRAASEKIAADLGVSADAVFRDVCERLMGTQGKIAADDRFFTGADAAIAGGGAAAGLGGVAASGLSQQGFEGRRLKEVLDAASAEFQKSRNYNKHLDHVYEALHNRAKNLQLEAEQKGIKSELQSVLKEMDDVEIKGNTHYKNVHGPAAMAEQAAEEAYRPYKNSTSYKLNKMGLTPERLKTLGTIGKITGGALGLGLLGKKTYDVMKTAQERKPWMTGADAGLLGAGVMSYGAGSGLHRAGDAINAGQHAIHNALPQAQAALPQAQAATANAQNALNMHNLRNEAFNDYSTQVFDKRTDWDRRMSMANQIENAEQRSRVLANLEREGASIAAEEANIMGNANKPRAQAIAAKGKELQAGLQSAQAAEQSALSAVDDAAAGIDKAKKSFGNKMHGFGLTGDRMKMLGNVGKVTGGLFGLGLLGKKTYDTFAS